jgi:tetratricopeptide (TPR) repeat protein
MRTALLLLLAPALIAAQTPEQLYRDRKFDDLRKAMSENLAKNKNDHRSMYWIGRAYEEEDKFGDAMDWFEKAIKLNDTSALYHAWLGNAAGGAAQRANKIKQPFLARKVKAEFERAVALDPKMLDPRFGLVDFYTMAPGFMGGSIEKAKQQSVEIGKLHPFRGHFAEARIANRQKDVAGEEKAYKAALAATPDSTTTFYNLASFYRRQSRWDDALALYDSLMKRHPQEIPVHASWGVTAIQAGKHLERTERELKIWLAAVPKEANIQTISFVHYSLGQVYERTARKELARAEYNDAIKHNPQNADAKKALGALSKE